jgi:catechol 2,3-dioxygenase-like lactoylglutathione lyase family enzyme
MVEHVSALIVVSEQARVVADFYREQLGIPLRDEQHEGGGEALHFGCSLGGLHFAVHPTENWPYARDVGPGGFRVAFRVADAEAEAERLRAAGQALEGPVDEGWSRMVRLRDPDGNYVELVQLTP